MILVGEEQEGFPTSIAILFKNIRKIFTFRGE